MGLGTLEGDLLETMQEELKAATAEVSHSLVVREGGHGLRTLLRRFSTRSNASASLQASADAQEAELRRCSAFESNLLHFGSAMCALALDCWTTLMCRCPMSRAFRRDKCGSGHAGVWLSAKLRHRTGALGVQCSNSWGQVVCRG